MAAPITAPNGQIQKRTEPPTQEQQLVGMVTRMSKEIARALPKHVTPDRMARIVITALRNTRNLAACDSASFLGCVMSASQLGLEVNTPLGQAYLIPRKVKDKPGKFSCTLMIGYQGMLDMIWRSGMVKSIDVDVVRSGDHFEYERGTNSRISHRYSEDDNREDQKITHAWASATLAAGGTMSIVLTRSQLEARASRAQDGGKSGPWLTDTAAMCKKTAVRELFKWVPKSSEVARAIAIDEATDSGQRQSDVWDPEITAALQSKGLEAPALESPAENLEDEEQPYDTETGEVYGDAPQVQQRPPSSPENAQPAPVGGSRRQQPRAREPGED